MSKSKDEHSQGRRRVFLTPVVSERCIFRVITDLRRDDSFHERWKDMQRLVQDIKGSN